LNKSNPNSNNKQIIITIFLAFIKDKEFTVDLDLICVLLNPQVNFTVLFSDWDTGSPIVSIVMPLLFSVSHNVSIDSGHSESWRRGENRKPGWAAECDLSATGY